MTLHGTRRKIGTPSPHSGIFEIHLFYGASHGQSRDGVLTSLIPSLRVARKRYLPWLRPPRLTGAGVRRPSIALGESGSRNPESVGPVLAEWELSRTAATQRFIGAT